MIARILHEDELDDAEAAVLRTIIAGKWAWSAQIFLVATGHDPALIAEMADRGESSLIVPWETPPDDDVSRSRNPPPCGSLVTLTPLGAARMHVEITEVGEVERPRWTRIEIDEKGNPVGDKGKRPFPANRFNTMLRLPREVEDPGPTPPEVLIDEFTGKPKELWGRSIPVDRKLARGKRGPVAKGKKGARNAKKKPSARHGRRADGLLPAATHLS